MIDHTPPDTAGLPRELCEAALRSHLGDDSAVVDDYHLTPLRHAGMSENELYRVRVSWRRPSDLQRGQNDWIAKHWQAGEKSTAMLGLSRPIEALAWRQGFIARQPIDGIPRGVYAPYLHALVRGDNRAAWVVMEDISAELDAYSRAHPRPPDVASERAHQVLMHLARFHAYWARPEQQERIASAKWMLELSDVLWREAATYSNVFGTEPIGGRAPGRVADKQLRAAVQGFLDWLPAADRDLWIHHLCDRRPLEDAFRSLPVTLLHGDLDDRNVGLRWRDGSSGYAELLLIDWEWMGLGPPTLDVAKLVLQFFVMCEPARGLVERLPQLLDELILAGFEHYISAGGVGHDLDTWRRGVDLALIKEHLITVTRIVGRLLLSGADAPSDAVPGMTVDEPSLMLHFLQYMVGNTTDVMRRLL